MGTSNAACVGRNCDCKPVFGSIACCERFGRQVQYIQLRRSWLMTLFAGTLVSGRVHWWETTTKCLWQEAST